jgi:hypothetical protein
LHKFKFVDCLAGFRGVLYPGRHLCDSRLPFTFFENLPAGVYFDDDIYFGIVLSMLKVPLFAIPMRLPRGVGVRVSRMEGGSAVQELIEKERTQNEAEILQHAYNKGYLSFAMANRKRQLSLKEQLGLAALQAGSRLNVEYLRTLYSRLRARRSAVFFEFSSVFLLRLSVQPRVTEHKIHFICQSRYNVIYEHDISL